MPTSATTARSAVRSESTRGRRQAPGSEAGFTLLEILIVAFLIGVLSVLFAPRIGKRLAFDLDNAAEILNAELRYAAERAVSTGETHRLVVDLEGQALRLEKVSLSEPPPPFSLPGTPALLDLTPPRPEQESKPVPERQGDWHSIDIDEVRIEAVLIGEQEFTDEKVAIAFGGDGGADAAALRLVDLEGNRLTLQVLPFTAEVKTSREDLP
jgi:prepilin-type N-terminal cleavage/methylation domain-containing protein